MPLFRQLSFDVLNPLACILECFNTFKCHHRIIAHFSEFFRVSMLFEKMEDKVKHFSEERLLFRLLIADNSHSLITTEPVTMLPASLTHR